ncbi:MAG: SDR family NAD(P)-dependent oxidoreductase [Proteobacteria bacterium]|nr:SDR family NAD(P)-dependent oxidoreductase [Pseudomonadota bacterium]MCP4465832.1 SDR family NAD(P)-dependent oxidoreductase [Halieaceae bacterium]MCP4843020.1 SDR family NAD(P)-dependent oxidoreductase [Halieaceae bacterium]
MYTNPKSILITGASSGIGTALALHYAAPGATLFISGRDQERLDEVARQCRDAGATVSSWVGDVTDEAGLKAWIYSCDDDCPLNLVIANAGVALGATEVKGLHQAAVDSFNINVNGVFNTVHPALEIMSSRRPYPVNNAQIAVMSSVMGYAGMARSPAYSSSKAAVKHYGQALRGAFRNMGIGVSVICPGYVSSALTARNSSTMPFLIDAEKAAEIIAKGLARDKARITFPWQMVLITRLAINLPGILVDRINKPWGVPRLEDQP